MNRYTKHSYKTFVLLTLTAILVTTASLMIAIASFTFTSDVSEVEQVMDLAIEWQLDSGGVVGIGGIHVNRYRDKLTLKVLDSGEINTLILGSSTMMGLRPSQLPGRYTAFNASKNRNIPASMIKESIYYLRKYQGLQNILLPIDWGLDFVEYHNKNQKFDPEELLEPQRSFKEMLSDTVSLQRLKILTHNLSSSFLYTPGTEYFCPSEGSVGIDILQAEFPLACNGSRADGSATYSRQSPMREDKWQYSLSEKATAGFRRILKNKQGKLEGDDVAGLKKIAGELASRGGNLILLFPPMIPEITTAIEKNEDGHYLTAMRNKIQQLASGTGIVFLDLSKSEEFGCKHWEFLDTHHAYPSCFGKAITASELIDLPPLLEESD